MNIQITKTEKKKKKGRFSKGILVFMLIFLLIFTSLCMYITYKTGIEPSSLIIAVFGFCGFEGGCMAWIKKTKEANQREDDVEC